MTDPDERERFRSLPEPVRVEDTVESVETAPGPAPEAVDARERLLREAGG